jgi:hypothetical protein
MHPKTLRTLWGVTLLNIYASSPGEQAGMIASHPINTQKNLLLVLVLEIPEKIEDENDQPPSFVRLLVKKSNGKFQPRRWR